MSKYSMTEKAGNWARKSLRSLIWLGALSAALCTLVPRTASAGYHITWVSDGSCEETTMDGYTVRKLAIRVCEDSIGYHYTWVSDGSCEETTTDGYFVRKLAIRVCEDSIGYHYTWASDGSCRETTPDGYYVRHLNITYCESSIGYHYMWTKGGACVETTPDWYIVKYISRSYCEQSSLEKINSTDGAMASLWPSTLPAPKGECDAAGKSVQDGGRPSVSGKTDKRSIRAI